KGWDARKRAYCLKIQPATGSFARNLIYSTKPICNSRTTFSIHKMTDSIAASPFELLQTLGQRMITVSF
ncbi:hypothetical protein, partial [Klebsiella pneumoniae]|uniref:hypothetical protein n=1 Tax=Klebsiella pneumoniae TaxID=573 RepID=UPI001C6F97AC